MERCGRETSIVTYMTLIDPGLISDPIDDGRILNLKQTLRNI